MKALWAERLRRRARAVRARARVRRWQYRQRDLAAGVWFRLRRVLADAREAYEISAAESQRLADEGYRPEPCGRELAPPKTIVFIDEERARRLTERQPLRVGLDPALLAARAIALVPFAAGRVKRAARG